MSSPCEKSSTATRRRAAMAWQKERRGDSVEFASTAKNMKVPSKSFSRRKDRQRKKLQGDGKNDYGAMGRREKQVPDLLRCSCALAGSGDFRIERPLSGADDEQKEQPKQHGKVSARLMHHAEKSIAGQLRKREHPESLPQQDRDFR